MEGIRLLFPDFITPISLFTMTCWCSLVSAVPFVSFLIHFFYISSVPMGSDSYLDWLHCYITSYGLFESTVYIQHPLKHFLVFPKDLSLGSTYLFITVLCNSIKHSVFFVRWNYQNCWFHKLCNWQYTCTIYSWFYSCSVRCWLYETEYRRKSEVQCWLILSRKDKVVIIWKCECKKAVRQCLMNHKVCNLRS
jgi:hypothetical protein